MIPGYAEQREFTQPPLNLGTEGGQRTVALALKIPPALHEALPHLSKMGAAFAGMSQDDKIALLKAVHEKIQAETQNNGGNPYTATNTVLNQIFPNPPRDARDARADLAGDLLLMQIMQEKALTLSPPKLLTDKALDALVDSYALSGEVKLSGVMADARDMGIPESQIVQFVTKLEEDKKLLIVDDMTTSAPTLAPAAEMNMAQTPTPQQLLEESQRQRTAFTAPAPTTPQ